MACRQMGARRPTIRDLTSMMAAPEDPRPSPVTCLLEDDDAVGCSGHHFLDECRMCGRYLPRGRDIYMYKGDTPFCSEDCRDEQIRIDEHQERINSRTVRRAKSAAASSAHVVNSQPTAAVAVAAV